MAALYAICLLAIFAQQALTDSNEVSNDVNAEDYLEKYGYLKPASKRAGPAARAAAKTKAITAFQEFAHLPVTGELDDETKAQMAAPRCGMQDVSTKRNRALVSSTWDTDVLTWKLVKGTNQIPDDRVRKALREAFAVWSRVIPMNFTEVSQETKADMQFDFGALEHGDPYKFDGRGNVLAHAFYPKDGRLHFDDDERWTYENAAEIKGGEHTDLLSVAIHEMGHALGLPHLSEREAIMFPFYRHPDLDDKDQIKPFVLSEFDIKAIQEAYGSREAATPEPTPAGGPSTGAACPSFQAAVTAADNATYFFSGNVGWRKADGGQGAPNSGTRFFLDRRFPNGPTQVTAAFRHQSDGVTYLFQGRRVWAYRYRAGLRKFALDSAFPKDLQNDVPFTPAGAFQLNSGHLILYQGNDFVIWSPWSNDVNYKSEISNFFGKFPTGTPFAYDNQLYFIDKNQYTVYDADNKRIVRQGQLKDLITC